MYDINVIFQIRVEYRVKTDPNSPKSNRIENRFCGSHEQRTKPNSLGPVRFCVGPFDLIQFRRVFLGFGSNRVEPS